MLWGPQVWLKQKPYADYAYQYSFKEGEPGKLTLEFYITPFDHADADGPELSCPTLLKEGNEIGLCWAVIDWDAHPTSKDGLDMEELILDLIDYDVEDEYEEDDEEGTITIYGNPKFIAIA